MSACLECLVGRLLVFRHAPQAVNFPIPFDQAGSWIVVVHAEISGPKRSSKAILAVAQGCFGLYALANVARDAGGAYDPAASIPDRRDRDRYINRAAILMKADRLIAFGLSGGNPRLNAVFSPPPVRGDEDAYRFTDNLPCAIAK